VLRERMVGVALPRRDRLLVGPVRDRDPDVGVSRLDTEETGALRRERQHLLCGLVVPIAWLHGSVRREDDRPIRRIRGSGQALADVDAIGTIDRLHAPLPPSDALRVILPPAVDSLNPDM